MNAMHETETISSQESVGLSAPATMLERLAEKLGVTARASTIYGEPVERDGLTVIPVAKAVWGLGGGGGPQGSSGRNLGMGGGGGVVIQPVGYIEMKNGESRFRNLEEESSGKVMGIALAAGVVLVLAALWRKRG